MGHRKMTAVTRKARYSKTWMPSLSGVSSYRARRCQIQTVPISEIFDPWLSRETRARPPQRHPTTIGRLPRC